MEEFIAAGVSRDHLKIINYIRMHLKAITLADIATPNGRRITFDAWNVIGSNNLRVEYDWPRSPPSFTQRQKGGLAASYSQNFYCSKHRENV